MVSKRLLTAATAALFMAGGCSGDSPDARAPIERPTTEVAAEGIHPDPDSIDSVSAPPTLAFRPDWAVADPRSGHPASAAALARFRAARDATLSQTGRFEGHVAALGGLVPFELAVDGHYDQAGNSESQLWLRRLGQGDSAESYSPDADHAGTDEAESAAQPIRVLSYDGQSYFRWPLLTAMFGGPDGAWLALSPEQVATAAGAVGGDSMGSLSPDPHLLFALLDQTTGEAQEIGAEKLRGVEVLHLRIPVDVAGTTGASGVAGEAPSPFDVWLDADGLVHRMRLETEMSAEDDPSSPQESVVVYFDVLDHGEPDKVDPPSPSTVFVPEDDHG